MVAISSGSVTEIAAGDAILTAYKAMGLPTVVGEATKYCNRDYPAKVASYEASDKNSIDDDVLTYTAAYGNVAFKSYCDGGAATLAAATAAVAVATISLYWGEIRLKPPFQQYTLLIY